MKDNLLPFWMAFAHAKGFSNKRKMDFLIEVVHHKNVPLDEALKAIKNGDKLGFSFEEKEWKGISEAALEVANYSFLAEQLTEKGISALNIMDKFVYPAVLKNNLKKDAPILVYAKGNMDLLKRNSIAIVGARKSNDTSLEFTKNIAKKAVIGKSVVVSGFAKGVDKMALDAALDFKGQSIIVLPQGIDTYTSKEYYPHIINGDVLVMSTYHPKAKWSVGLAMDRNKTIYGLAQEIYAAESNDSGGTWEGVLNGLKRGRKVFVRKPEKKENNANLLLIQKGATPVDFFGNETTLNGSGQEVQTVSKPEVALPASEPQPVAQPHQESEAREFEMPKAIERVGNSFSDSDLTEKVINILKNNNGKGLKVNELANLLELDEKTVTKASTVLSKSPKLKKEKKGRFNIFYLNEELPKQGQLF